MPNATHRKRLARLYAAHAGITYMEALRAVADAANNDRLPSRLDEAGMQAAMRILTSGESTFTATIPAALAATGTSPDVDAPVRRTASDPRDQQLYDLSFRYETLTGEQGLLYITSPTGKADKYVFGGGFVALGRKEARDHLETLVADAALLRGGGERYYLIPEALRLLRQVWQGRVTRTVKGYNRATFRFAIDDKEASDINDLHLMWLHKHRYIEANLSPGEQWALARTTTFGDEVLSRNGADTDKFHDGLPDNSQPAGPSMLEGPGASDDANPYLNFDTTSTMQADVRGLLKVHQRIADAGRVEWWWHRGPFKGMHGFKTVERVNDDGDLVLLDEDPRQIQKRTPLALDYIDDPEEAARHLIWPDYSGVTFRDKTTGEIDATYRVAGPKPEPAAKSSGVRKVTRRPKDNPSLDPAVDRLMGGPTTTKVYDNHDRRVNATCDVCNRRLTTGEPWWMVHSPNRDWENNAGVVCSNHSPDSLPLHTVSDENATAPDVDLRANADAVAEAAARTVHAARPANPVDVTNGSGHCAVCHQRVKRVPGGQGPTWIHVESGAVAAAGGDHEHPLVRRPTRLR